MTLADVYTTLTGVSGFATKVTYYAWPVGAAPALPFICYLATGANNFAADGQVYHSATTVDVELYTATKDLTVEASIEAALTAAGFFWSKQSEEYLEDENCYEIIYEIEV